MAELPQTEFGIAQISEWFGLKQQLGALKAKEALARAFVFKHIFEGKETTKLEGTNKFELPQHYELKAVTSLNRKVDIETLRAIAPDLALNGVIADDLIEWEPKLKLREYRELTEEQMKMFDMCLTITPGTPQMDVVLPAKYKNASGQSLTPPTVAAEKTVPF
jgi:hypothetical protein